MNYELSSKHKFILKQNLDKFKQYYNINSIDELDNIRNLDKSFIISNEQKLLSFSIYSHFSK